MAVPTLTANSPSSGDIAWTAFHIQYNGASYAVDAGNTGDVYVYWLYNGGSPSATLSTSNAQPTLTADDLLLFINKNGIPVNVQFAQLIDGSLIVDGSILAASIAAGTIEGTNIAAGTIEGDNIAAGTITSDLIAANAIVAGLIDAGAIDGMDINGVTITGAVINATSGGVFVYTPGGTVLNANPDFTSGITDWTAVSGLVTYEPPTYTPAGGAAHDTMLIDVSTDNPVTFYWGEAESEAEAVTAGDSYFCDFIIQSSGLEGAEAEVTLSVLWSNGTSTQVASLPGNIDTWTEYTGLVTAPAGATSMSLDVLGHSVNAGGTVSVARAAITSEPMLAASIAAAAGTDSYGNAYEAGVTAYDTGGGSVSLLALSGQAQVSFRPTGETESTENAYIYSGVTNPGAVNESQWMIATSGKSNGERDAGILLNSEPADASASEYIMFDLGGQDVFYADRGQVCTFAASPLGVYGYGWEDMTLLNGWSTTQYAQYKLMSNNTVAIRADGLLPGTISDNTPIWAAPSGYVPVYNHNVPLMVGYSSAPAYGSNPKLYMRTNGNLCVYDLRGTVANIAFNDFYHLS